MAVPHLPQSGEVVSWLWPCGSVAGTVQFECTDGPMCECGGGQSGNQQGRWSESAIYDGAAAAAVAVSDQ